MIIRRISNPFLVFLITVTVSVVTTTTEFSVPAWADGRAISIYGGRVTRDKWFESLPPGVNYADAYILATGLTWPLKSLRDGAVTLEIEGQVVKHFGDQDHLEFNLPVAARWHEFKWDDSVDTSMAFGLGPSWATEEPEVEAEVNGTTRKFLLYWFAEISLGPPDRGWSVILRLHHRSKAFGLVAEEGGSNTLVAGIRFDY